MSAPLPLTSRQTSRFGGSVRVPGDKSISHRALMLAALAEGETEITGLLEGEDVLCTAAVLVQLGVSVTKLGEGHWRVSGKGGDAPFTEPSSVLDMGNSGTAARLLLGLLASRSLTAFITGDASLVRRPMARVTDPLSGFGARFVTRQGGRLPLALVGATQPTAITYRLPVASAQVKSAILLAGMGTPGRTTVFEPEPTRDHTERMIRHFGGRVDVVDLEEGAQAVSVEGGQTLHARPLPVPGDPSSAAFAVVGTLLHPGSTLTIPGIGINPRRIGLYQTLLEMGAHIRFDNEREIAGEPVADVVVNGDAPLHGITVPASRAPAMIDEYPILAMAAACASGTTRLLGLKELRVKESDRLAMIAQGLGACGAVVEAGDDSLTIHGTGQAPRGGAAIATALDHRIAMSFLILGTTTPTAITIDDGTFIDTSFPGFVSLMNALGAAIG